MSIPAVTQRSNPEVDSRHAGSREWDMNLKTGEFFDMVVALSGDTEFNILARGRNDSWKLGFSTISVTL